MIRALILAALAAGMTACAAEPSRAYVVRLDLEQIAADTATRDTSPGFATLRE
jgi:hypothetical protein